MRFMSRAVTVLYPALIGVAVVLIAGVFVLGVANRDELLWLYVIGTLSAEVVVLGGLALLIEIRDQLKVIRAGLGDRLDKPIVPEARERATAPTAALRG
jgi:hypothetical protein